MRYKLEASNSGYPIEMDEFDKDWIWENEHHLCIYCGERSHEDALIHTDCGWAHEECYDYEIENSEP